MYRLADKISLGLCCEPVRDGSLGMFTHAILNGPSAIVAVDAASCLEARLHLLAPFHTTLQPRLPTFWKLTLYSQIMLTEGDRSAMPTMKLLSCSATELNTRPIDARAAAGFCWNDEGISFFQLSGRYSFIRLRNSALSLGVSPCSLYRRAGGTSSFA